MVKTKKKRLLWLIPTVAVGTALLVVLTYVLYVILSYSRIPDYTEVEVGGNPSFSMVETGVTYVAVTQNIGFGAYTDEFTFFMDGGTQSRAQSAESVLACVDAALTQVTALSPDIVFFQEVDLDATRSYHINQVEILNAALQGYANCCAVNYDSAYLFYPILEPHGASRSSLVTFSRFAISASLRRSFPISTSLSKLLDLDRCYVVSRVPVENGKELVLYNVHSSAYGSDDAIRTAQMKMLMEDMAAEYAKGNYVICAGDFNHDFTGDSTQKLNGGDTVDFGWAQPFPEHLIQACFYKFTDYTSLVPTCRNCDVPYEPGNFTLIVDGFIVGTTYKITVICTSTGEVFVKINTV